MVATLEQGEVGSYKEQLCCLCLRPITQADALTLGGGVQAMEYGCRAHRRCYEERYHQPASSGTPPVLETQAQLDLFEQERPPEGPTIAPPATVANPLYLAWQIVDRGQDVDEAIGDAAERYVEKYGEHPNAVLLNERDWKRSGLGIGEVVHGCSVRVSFMLPDMGELRVAKE